MKKITFLLLLLCAAANSQVISFADPLVKNQLVEFIGCDIYDSAGNHVDIDTNNDGEIQLSETLAVHQISFYNNQDVIISMGGLEMFPNLKKLSVVVKHLQSASFSGFPQLEELRLQDNPNLQTVSIINIPTLKELRIIDYTALNAVNYNGLANLRELRIEHASSLTSLNVLSLPALRELYIDLSPLTALDCSSLSNLQSLTLYANLALTSLTLPTSSGLKQLSLTDLPLNTLDLTGQSALENLTLDNNNAIEQYDLSQCTNLETLKIFLTQDSIQRYINMKNGISQYDELNLNLFATESGRLYICIDEGNESILPPAVLANPNITVSSYCTFTPGGDHNTITGTFTFDSDNNGCSSNDPYAGLIRVGISNGIESFGAITGSGSYAFYPEAGTYTLTPHLENNWFTVTPPSATVTFPAVNTTATQNFCITPNGMHSDVEVVMVPIGPAQPGFDASYKIVYRNKGNQTASGSVSLSYNDDVLDYLTAIPSATGTATGSLNWNYSNLLPFETRSVYVSFNINGPMETPAVNIDDVLDFTAAVSSATGDETLADNTFAYSQTVTGAYDPNDITCLEGPTVNPQKIGDFLHYTINFENTGNAPATFVVLKDIIDTASFDLSSLQVMYASHAMNTRINGNKVEFIFDAINLAPQGKGNVVFKVRTNNSLQANDAVMQKASIYFDYNWPVVTNEAITTFQVLSVSPVTAGTIKVYPNPAHNLVNLTAEGKTIRAAVLYDIQGRLLHSEAVNATSGTLDISRRANGLYLLQIETESGTETYKVIKN